MQERNNEHEGIGYEDDGFLLNFFIVAGDTFRVDDHIYRTRSY